MGLVVSSSLCHSYSCGVGSQSLMKGSPEACCAWNKSVKPNTLMQESLFLIDQLQFSELDTALRSRQILLLYILLACHLHRVLKRHSSVVTEDLYFQRSAQDLTLFCNSSIIMSLGEDTSMYR